MEDQMNEFKTELLKFENSARLMDRKTDVFKWWTERQGTTLLKEVAYILLSFPVTQVSVERLFSGLRFIMNDLRGCLADSTVKNIMLLRMNKSF